METYVKRPRTEQTAGGMTQEVSAPMCPQDNPPDPRRALAKEMTKAGVRQREIAKALGVDPSTIYRWVHDKTYKPKPWTSEPVDHPRWVGDNSDNVMTGHHRARRLYSMGLCELCGEQGMDRHHKDGNTFNNKPENVQILCRRCHMQADGRMEQFLEVAKQNAEKARSRPSVICSECGRPARPSRKGLCSRCYDRALYRRSEKRRTRGRKTHESPE